MTFREMVIRWKTTERSCPLAVVDVNAETETHARLEVPILELHDQRSPHSDELWTLNHLRIGIGANVYFSDSNDVIARCTRWLRPKVLRSGFNELGKIRRNDRCGRPRLPYGSPLQPHYPMAQRFHGGHVVAHENNRPALARCVSHFAEAFFLERGIPDGQHLVD